MKRFILNSFFVTLFLCTFVQAQAQRNPLGSQYYINPYIINPAMAGAENGLKLNGAFRRQKENAPGAPVTQSITAGYGFDKTGLGLNLNNDQAGLLRETRIMGSFAYHLPLDGQQQFLHFGVSAGVMSRRIDLNDLNGNGNDVSVGQYNNQQNYVDGDFGVAYSSSRLTLQGSIVNLKHFFKKDVLENNDQADFYSSVSYRLSLDDTESSDLTPLIAYRGMENVSNVWDAGLQLGLANRQFYLSTIYHSTKSATFGIGVNYLKKYLINGMYSVNTNGVGENTNGSFEISFGLRI